MPVVGEDRRYLHTFGANAALAADDIAATALRNGRSDLRRRLPDPPRPARRRAGAATRRGAGPRRRDHPRRRRAVAQPTSRSRRSSRLLPLVDYFIPNLDEARALTGRAEPQPQAERAHRARRAHGDDQARRARRSTFAARSGASTLAAPPVTWSSRRAPATRSPPVSPSGSSKAGSSSARRGLRASSARSACTALGCADGVFTRARGRCLPRRASAKRAI